MFCSNCGSPLAEGAKFCSECGTKVEGIKVRDFGISELDELSSVTDTPAEKTMGAEEAFESRVSFDWSNVIDEPQKKEISQELKSPWAAATGSIDDRELYSGLTQPDDKNRTLTYIDVLKADRQERERAALGGSIEHTEIPKTGDGLPADFEPPKMHVPPLYDDVDEPVRTPFDDLAQTASFDTGAFDAPARDTSEISPIAETSQEKPVEADSGAGKFELPDFLKRAVGFGAAKQNIETVERTEKDPETDNDNKEMISEEPVFEAPAAEEPVFEAPAAEETQANGAETSSDIYLNEDIYLDLEEREPLMKRMSRVDAHTLAGDYDMPEEESEEPAAEETPVEDAAPMIDEKALFSEMAETPGSRTTGMTIAAPADEEEEIAALKRRLAELTGTVEIDPEELKNAEPKETPQEIPAAEGLIEDMPVDREPRFEDFIFEPEISPEDDSFFEGLILAKERAHADGHDNITFEPAQVKAIDFEPPSPIISDDQKAAFERLNIDIPTAAPAEEVSMPEPADEEQKFEPFEAAAEDYSPIVGFAPAVTEPVVEKSELPGPERQVEAELKASDALSLEEIELFGDSPEDAAEIETKKIDKFYTLYRKNAEFQRLLDEEYSKQKGEHIVVPEDGDYTADDEGDTKPIEDATIYQEMPKELKDALPQTELTEAPKIPSFGLDGTETLGAAAVAGAAASAVIAGGEEKTDQKAAKAEVRAAKKAAKEAKKAEKAAAKALDTADPQVEYENVDGGSTILTILAVLVAILLVVLLVIILILHVAPGSDIAIKIDEFIQGITERFSMINTYRGMRVL